MAVVIMKSRGWSGTQIPHAVWEGSYKDAVKWCENKNCSACSYTYEAVKVKTESVQS